MTGLQILVYENQQLVHTTKCSGVVELGRQSEGEEGPYMSRQEGNRWRVVIAPLDDKRVSRRFLSVEPLWTGNVRITNLSRSPIRFFDGRELDPGATREMMMPVFLTVADKKIGIQPVDATLAALPLETPTEVERPRAASFRLQDGNQLAPLQTLSGAMVPPGASMVSGRARLAPLGGSTDLHDETMIGWLQAAMDVLQSAASSSEFFDKAAAALVDLVGLDLGQVLLLKSGKWHLQSFKASPKIHLADERQASRHILGRLVAEKRTFWQVPTATPQGSLVGVDAVVAAPILDKSGEVIGALYGDRHVRGFSASSGAPLTKQEALLVELLAGGVATGMARMEREQAESQRQKKFMLYERELQIGRNIQIGFLPEVLPQPPGWEVVAHFQPAREVAGDFYDCFSLAANRVVLVMADVCDKGVGAALFMALFRSLIRAFCVQSPLRPFMGITNDHTDQLLPTILPSNRFRAGLLGDVVTLLTVEHTNKYVTSNHASACMFVTLFIGVLDTTTGELSYVNAGHDSPTIIGPNGIKTRLEPTGPVVGLMPDASFELKKTSLERGDILLMHTDGVTDARDPKGKSFSEKRFLSLLEGTPTAAALVERLSSELRSFIGDADQFDDITLLAARWVPEAPK